MKTYVAFDHDKKTITAETNYAGDIFISLLRGAFPGWNVRQLVRTSTYKPTHRKDTP